MRVEYFVLATALLLGTCQMPLRSTHAEQPSKQKVEEFGSRLEDCRMLSEFASEGLAQVYGARLMTRNEMSRDEMQKWSKKIADEFRACWDRAESILK